MDKTLRSKTPSSISLRRLAQAAVLGLLTAGALAMGGPSATAAGTSEPIFNCYTQWWNTAWAQKCDPDKGGAKWAGTYESSISCSAQGTRYLTKGRLQGSTTTTYSGSDCTFSASNGKITYY